MRYLPIFYDLKRGPSLVVGGGDIACRKIESLRNAGASVVVVATQASPAIQTLAAEGALELHQRAFAPADLDDKLLVIAATADDAVNETIATLATARRIPVNVVDNPRLCSFIMPSIIDRSPVVVAVSTGGAAPVLARLLRARLETLIPSSYGRLAALMEDFRDRVKTALPNATNRRRFWENAVTGAVAERIFEGKYATALSTLERMLENRPTDPPGGEVYLVGGGPGDPDLLTFRALRLMQQADVIVYDRLVADEIVALCRKDAERVYVGKQRDQRALDQAGINTLLVSLAREGKRVLRLKGGDPFIFGRGGEEIETLAAHGIAFQIVPGVSAANGCAAYAGIPLTHRDYAQQCVFVTGHQQDGRTLLPWAQLVAPQQTVVIYMGVHGLEELCAKLIAHGMDGELPAAIVERGTTPEQRVLVATVRDLPARARAAEFRAPSLIILGEVVRLREKLAWFEAANPMGEV
mgnify:CR=1 FL=1|jgi:uroporphyrin-III C-methyltransferase/precorrin-2 dehydrogenase/sirohydrochlorin ferrochelatase